MGFGSTTAFHTWPGKCNAVMKQPVCWCVPMPESLLTLLKKEDIYLNGNKKIGPQKYGQIPLYVTLSIS